MNIGRSRCILAVISCMLLSAGLAAAHPGGMDANGGHRDKKNGGYHFHKGPLNGQSFATKEEGLAALKNQPNAPAETTPEHATPTSLPLGSVNLEALIRLLIAKGIITEAELQAAAAELPDGAGVEGAAVAGAAGGTAKPDSLAPKTGIKTGETTASGQTIYEGPRGGRYHYSKSGKKVYEKKRK